jgi:hypothetical protein
MSTKTASKRKRGRQLRSSELVSRAWAWKIQDDRGRWLLCSWAVASRQVLMAEGKPSPEAKAVHVTLHG